MSPAPLISRLTAWRPPTWVLLLAGAAILALRRPDQMAHPQLWAEDGIFFFQARVIGWKAFTLELAGYLHLAPRLIAALAQGVDPRWVPHVFIGCAGALTLYIMSRAWSSRCPLPFRAGAAFALVLVPDAAEPILSAANVQWIFAPGFLLLLLSAEPERTAQRAHDLGAAILFGLTGPFSILMTPFFAWRAWARRTRWSAVLLIVVAGCALVQAITVWRHPQPLPPDAALNAAAFWAFPGWRVLGGLLAGPWLPMQLPAMVGIALTVLLFALVAFLAARGANDRETRRMLALAFVAFLASTWARCWHSMPALCIPDNATRYVFPLQVVLAWLLLLTLQDPRRPVRLGVIIALGWMLAINVPRLRLPGWPDLHWENYAAQLRAGEEVTIPIHPPGYTFPFPKRER